MSNDFNPNVTLTAPFPRLELPTLHTWTERIWTAVGDDTQPRDLSQWMNWQIERESQGLATWAAYKYEELGGYFEASEVNFDNLDDFDPTLRSIAQVKFVLKKDVLWGRQNRATALNRVLADVFANGCQMCFFPVFQHNRSIQELFKEVGAGYLGLVTPRTQDGNPVPSVMWAVAEPEWRRANFGFLAALDGETAIRVRRESESDGTPVKEAVNYG